MNYNAALSIRYYETQRAARSCINVCTKALPPNELQHDRHQRYDFQRKSQLRAADTQNKLHRRPANNNVDCSNIKNSMHTPHRGGEAKAMKQPCATTPPPRERQQKPHPPRTNMRTKGRATVQTTTQTTAASPDARRRHGPHIAPTAAPA